MHFHYELFAEILHDLAKSVSSLPLGDAAHRDRLRDGAEALYLALDADVRRGNPDHDIFKLTPDEEVLLLHVIE
jgi:hypothetical protein